MIEADVESAVLDVGWIGDATSHKKSALKLLDRALKNSRRI